MMCMCGHYRKDHFDAGEGCSECGCWRYRPYPEPAEHHLALAERKPDADAVGRALASAWNEDLKRMRRQVEALPTTRTKGWLKGWDSVSLDDVLAMFDERGIGHGTDSA